MSQHATALSRCPQVHGSAESVSHKRGRHAWWVHLHTTRQQQVFPGCPRWPLTFPLTPFLSTEVWAVPPQRWCPQEDRQWRSASLLYCVVRSFRILEREGLTFIFPISSSGWAHVVCALYIPEVQFANVLTMEPIILQYVPHERYLKVHTSTLRVLLSVRKKYIRISFFSNQIEIWHCGKAKLFFWLWSQTSPSIYQGWFFFLPGFHTWNISL